MTDLADELGLSRRLIWWLHARPGERHYLDRLGGDVAVRQSRLSRYVDLMLAEGWITAGISDLRSFVELTDKGRVEIDRLVAGWDGRAVEATAAKVRPDVAGSPLLFESVQRLEAGEFWASDEEAWERWLDRIAGAVDEADAWGLLVQRPDADSVIVDVLDGWRVRVRRFNGRQVDLLRPTVDTRRKLGL